MGFFIEDNLFLTDVELIEKKKRIISRKVQLLQHFRNYVLNYLRKKSEPLDVQYELINNDPNICFKNLEVGTKFIYEKISFKFNLQRELTTEYFKYRYVLTKLYDRDGNVKIEDVAKGSDIANVKPRAIGRLKNNLSIIPDFERQEIIKRIQLEVDNILRKVFKGELTFNDEKFKKLVQINAYLENELREIDGILGTLDNDLERKHKN